MWRASWVRLYDLPSGLSLSCSGGASLLRVSSSVLFSGRVRVDGYQRLLSGTLCGLVVCRSP
jgi:hypothetical protein